MADFAGLAATAHASSEDDWGTERQIEAENLFFAECEKASPETFGEDSNFSDWCLKATSDERIDEALRLLRERGLLLT